MLTRFYTISFFIICLTSTILAQTDTLSNSFPTGFPPSAIVKAAAESDSTRSDSIPPPVTRSYPLSEDGLDADLDYGGDSTWMEVNQKRVHLYGKAYVNYNNIKLEAGYIIFNLETDEAEAQSILGPTGKQVQPPTFKMDEKEFSYKALRFNFKTKKGIVTDAITTEGEFIVHGARTKFVSQESDSLLTSDEIYNTDALITTCNHPHPHFGIRSRKLKVVPDKLAVVGFSQMEIAGVPLPLFLPFGFFPLVEGESSGLIFPEDYEFDPNFGLGFKEIGYYFPINDYVDLRLTGDIYTRGTWRLRARSNYRKRYAFTGNVNLQFSNNKLENATSGDIDSQKSFSFTLSHRQDAKAHPYRTIGGTINIQTNNHQQRNFNDAASQLNNRLSSNFNFEHSLPGTPFRLVMGLSHDQNNQTRQVNITLPDIRVNMNQVFPFKRKNGSGDEKWYEKFAVKYDFAAKNLVKATDTTLISQQTLDDLQSGISHTASTNASFRMFNYFNVTPNAKYEELWFFTTEQRTFDPETTVSIQDTLIDPDGNLFIRADTTYGTVTTETERGFAPVRLFNMGLNVQTTIFGTKTFSKGFLRGIRHIMKPTVSFNYSPDSEARYLEVVDTDNREAFNDPDEYNPYIGGAIRRPTFTGRQMALNFSVSNTFEGKYYSKKDSTEKKFKLLNNLTLRGGYNFATDSLNWSDLSYSGNTRLFGLITVNFSGMFSPYVYNGLSKTSTLLASEDRGLIQFRNFSLNLSTTSIKISQIRDLFREKPDENDKKGNTRNNKSPEQNGPDSQGSGGVKKPQSILDLIDNFTLDYRYNIEWRKDNQSKTQFFTRANSLTLRGRIPLTDKWQINIGSITYDFDEKAFVYPSFGISRDLHCWNMNFNWYPDRGVYSFFIGVKSNALNFVKYNYGQGNAGNFLR